MEPCLQDPSHIQFRVDTMMVQDGKTLKAATPDEHGYFVGMPVAGLGFPTRNKTYYEVNSFANCINSPNSTFRRRLNSGSLYGEIGHPNIAGLTKEEVARRMLNIDEKNYAVFYRNVYISPEKLPNGGKLILADIKPFGPGEDMVRKNFEDPYMNTSFSLRSITQSRPHNGLSYRVMTNLITFDWVGAGGYGEASKRYSPSLENLESVEDFEIEFESNAIITNEFSLEYLRDTFLNELFHTNKIAQVTQRKSVIIPNKNERVNRYSTGLTSKRIRDIIGPL